MVRLHCLIIGNRGFLRDTECSPKQLTVRTGPVFSEQRQVVPSMFDLCPIGQQNISFSGPVHT